MAWVLNLDADLELASKKRYAPTSVVRRAMQPHVARLASSLLGAQDRLVDDRSAPGVVPGFLGRAFCPTAGAIAILKRAGAEPEPHPSHEILRRVNGRAFCASLGQTLAGATFEMTSEERAFAHLASAPETSRSWRVKRPFGMAGRGQRVVRPEAITEDDRRFIRASIASEGGVQIEPNVVISRELAMHGMLDPRGVARFGRLVEQRCDAFGQWIDTVVAAPGVRPADARAIGQEVERVAEALHHAGYFGPFGVDAFLFHDLAGAEHVQSRSEINARYSMGFAVGMRH